MELAHGYEQEWPYWRSWRGHSQRRRGQKGPDNGTRPQLDHGRFAQVRPVVRIDCPSNERYYNFKSMGGALAVDPPPKVVLRYASHGLASLSCARYERVSLLGLGDRINAGFDVGSFLAALFYSLTSSVERSLATGLRSQFLACLLVYIHGVSSHDPSWEQRVSAGGQDVPAFFFSRKAKSSSSRSLVAFLAALRGLAFPPVFRESEDITIYLARMQRVVIRVCEPCLSAPPILLDWM